MNNSAKPVLKLDRHVRFVDEIFRIMAREGSDARAVDLVRNAEKETKLELTTVVPFPPQADLPSELFQTYVEGALYDFLSATNLVLGAAEASRLQLIFSDGYTLSLGLREWAHVITTWANRVRWLGRIDWQFGEFTGGPSDATIENYSLWSATAMRILKLKCRNRILAVEQLIPELSDHLQKSPDKQMRHAAATTLGTLGNEDAKSLLQMALETETDETIRGDIRYYLSLAAF